MKPRGIYERRSNMAGQASAPVSLHLPSFCILLLTISVTASLNYLVPVSVKIIMSTIIRKTNHAPLFVLDFVTMSLL